MKIIDIPLQHGGGKQTPNQIIIHAMAEFVELDKATAAKFHVKPGPLHALLFLQAAGLSEHTLITPAGITIRSRPADLKAWHAKNHNVDSLGIAFLVPGNHDYASFIWAMETDYVTPLAYRAGLDQVRTWCDHWQIDDITTHSAVDPRRKFDPGHGFPYDKFLQDL